MTENMINLYLMNEGLKASSVLLKDDFDGVKGNHVHEVSISRDNCSVKVEFTSGCAHRTHPRTGKPPVFYFGRGTTVDQKRENMKTRPNAPKLIDVVYSLLVDASCVRYGQTFEEYCSEMGDDPDSRSAEKCYNGCTESWRKLIRLGLDMNDLEEVFQDY